MAYIGIDPMLKAYSSVLFKAVGGETTLPIQVDAECLLVQSGRLLTPEYDYYTSDTGNVILNKPAVKDDMFFLVNLSSFSFSNVATLDDIKAQLDTNARPLFEVIWWPKRSSIPDGFLPADGQEESRMTYPDAWTAIQAGSMPIQSESAWQGNPHLRASFTTGDGSTTFRLPDYNGKTTGSISLFMRGDGNNADKEGEVQDATIQSHDHSLNNAGSAWMDVQRDGASPQFVTPQDTGTRWICTSGGAAGSQQLKVERSGSNETRPTNVAGVWCIRLYNGVVNTGVLNAAGLQTEIAVLKDRVDLLELEVTEFKNEVKHKLGQWYRSDTPEFMAMFSMDCEGWEFQGNESAFIETDNEIRVRGILRGPGGSGTVLDFLEIKNPNNAELFMSYSPFFPNEIGMTAGISWITLPYAQPFGPKSGVIRVNSSNSIMNTRGWIMFDFSFLKRKP